MKKFLFVLLIAFLFQTTAVSAEENIKDPYYGDPVLPPTVQG